MRIVKTAPFLRGIIVLLMFGGLVSSCNTVRKNFTYFQDLESDTTLTGLMHQPAEVTIIPGDFLSIKVAGLSNEFSDLYNMPPDDLDDKEGYMVNKEGNIEFIRLGAVHVAGMTTGQLREKLKKDLQPYLGETIAVSVGIKNHHITMLGGISSKILPLTQNMTLLDALASSGDIQQKGNIDKVLVIRNQEDETSKSFKRINLKDKSIFYSEYFYLEPNDIVYVEPSKERWDGLRIATFGMSTLTFVLAMFTRIFR